MNSDDRPVRSLTLRDLSAATRHALRVQAGRHGRSVEEEAKAILDHVLKPPHRLGLGARLAAIGRDFNAVDLCITRDPAQAEPATFL